jgi:hypothetical protein
LPTCCGLFHFLHPEALVNRRTQKVVTFALVALAATMSLAIPTAAQATPFDFESLPVAISTSSVTQTVDGLTLTVHRFDSRDFTLTSLLGAVPAFGSRTIGNNLSPQGPNQDMIFSFSAPVVAMSISFGDFFGDDDRTVTMTPFVGPDATGSSRSGVSTVYPAFLHFLVQGDGAIRSLALASVGGVTFQSVVVSIQGDPLFFDNVTATAVPEPASILLIGTGLAGLSLRRRYGPGHIRR